MSSCRLGRWKVLSFALLCLSYFGSAQPAQTSFGSRRPFRTGDAAADLYFSILNSAESASGTLHVGFSSFDGRTSSSRSGQGGIWHIDAGTIARVDFSLRGETWERLALDFSDHPISLQVAADTAFPGFLRIAKVTYGHDGTVRDLYAPGGTLITNFDRRGLSPGTPIGFYSSLLSNIKLPPQLNAVLAGQGLANGPFVFSSVTVSEPQGDNLVVVLRPAATLPIGGQMNGRCDPDLTFSQSPAILWNALTYEGASGHLEATIGNFVAGIANGCVAAGGTELKIGPGAQLNVSGLEFGQPARGENSHISLRAANFKGGLLPGSNIALGRTGNNTSLLSAGMGGTFEAEYLEMGMRDDGHTLLVVKNGRSHLSQVSGEVAPDAKDFIRFAAAECDLTLGSAMWIDSLTPQVMGAVTPGQVSLSSGLITFSSATAFLLGGGSAILGVLAINTSGEPQITGAFLAGEIKLAARSTVGVDRNFSLEAGPGGTLQIRSPDQLVFAADSPGPHGHITANAPVASGDIELDRNGKLSIVSGQFDLSLTSNGISRFSGQIGGNLAVGASLLPLGGAALTAVSNGSLRFDTLTFTADSPVEGPLPGLTLALADSGTAPLSATFEITPTSGSTVKSAASGQPTIISASGITGGLKLHAGFSAGKALFAADSSFVFTDGQLDGALVRAPAGGITGSVILSSNLNGGSVRLDAITTLPVSSGSHIASGELQLNADGKLSGLLSSAHLVLAPKGTISATRGRQLTLADNSSYDSNPGNPLRFSESDTLPTGDGQIAARFSKMEYQDTPTVTLENGELDATVSRSSSEHLEWTQLVVKGDQNGSYQNVFELPVDEYDTVSRFPSGAVQSLIAANRVMIVSTIPIAMASAAIFDDGGHLVNAVLARDATVFGVPLAGGSAVEVNAPASEVLVGTIGEDTTIDGVPYSKGCLAHLPPTDADKQVPPCELVTSLAVRITTSSDLLAGANDPITGKTDDIWLDIGPKAWLISGGGDFSRGATTTVSVDPSNVLGDDCSALTPGSVPLYVSDIVKVRIEKKGIWLPGICGIAEGPDSTADVGDLIPTKPSDVLKNISTAVQAERQLLELEREAIEKIGKEIDDANDAIDKAQAILNKAADLDHKVTDTQNTLLDLQNRLLNVPDELCQHKSGLECALAGPLCLVCVANSEYQDITNQITNWQKELNTRLADVAAFAAQKQVALDAQTAKLALKATKATLLETENIKFAAMNKLADGMDIAVTDLTTLINEVVPGIDIPMPGQWKPDTLTLIVNGRDYVTFQNTKYGRLRQGHSEWKSPVRAMGDGEYFAQGLRVNLNKQGCVPSGPEIECGWDTFLTTPLAKMRGYSGWDNLSNLGNVTVTGILRHEPSPGADAYVSFDLEVRTINVGGRTFVMGGANGIRATRYIRIEYLHGSDMRFDASHEHWKLGDTLRVTGPAKRDRDRTTFFEIHPTGTSSIDRIAQ